MIRITSLSTMITFSILHVRLVCPCFASVGAILKIDIYFTS